MLYTLSFTPEFFWGTVPVEKIKPSSRPTSVYQAILSHPQWNDLARDVFHCDPANLDVETVLKKVMQTNTCRNLDPPVEVLIDPDGFYAVRVY